MKRDWDDLIFKSTSLTLLEMQKAFRVQDFTEVEKGLNLLTEYFIRCDKTEVASHLEKLMTLIMNGMTEPKMRIGRWVNAIDNERDEIDYFQKNILYIDDEFIKSIWNECFQTAKEFSEIDTQRKISIESLSWYEVFEKEYLSNYRQNLQELEKQAA